MLYCTCSMHAGVTIMHAVLYKYYYNAYKYY